MLGIELHSTPLSGVKLHQNSIPKEFQTGISPFLFSTPFLRRIESYDSRGLVLK